MPRRSPRPCTVPDCPELVDGGGKCPTHRRQADRNLKRRHTWRDYDAGWQALRARVLAEEPCCRLCGAPSVDVDHIDPTRAGPRRRDRDNLQALCRSCHSKKTAREQGLGGRPDDGREP